MAQLLQWMSQQLGHAAVQLEDWPGQHHLILVVDTLGIQAAHKGQTCPSSSSPPPSGYCKQTLEHFLMGAVRENKLAGQTAVEESGADPVGGQILLCVFIDWQLGCLLHEDQETF